MPRFDVNFAGVYARTPIWKKGDYEVEIVDLRGIARNKLKNGVETGEVTAGVFLRPKLVGAYNPDGKLVTEIDGVDITDQPVEDIGCWVHSKQAMAMTKRVIMAFLGYREDEEEDFNNFVLNSGLDFSFDYDYSEDGSGGYVVTLGDGWRRLIGARARVHMDKRVVELEGREPFEQQQFVRFSPVNK